MPSALALTDPTGGKAFLPWMWQDQLKPTIKEAGEKENLTLLGAQLAGTLAMRPYDRKIYHFQQQNGNLLVGKEDARRIGVVTHGFLGIGIALTQMMIDQTNGLSHARALVLTSLSHLTLSYSIQRERPNKLNKLSYPSGHTSSAFATASSLAYAYGPKAGIPAFAAASLVGLSRIKGERHWASDVVGGAVMGIFWARASHQTDKPSKSDVVVTPLPLGNGMALTLAKDF